MTTREWVVRHDTAAFLILTFGVSWPLWLTSGALQQTPVMAPNVSWFVAQLGVFAPGLAGLIVGSALEPGGRRLAWRTLLCVYAPAGALAFWVASRGFESFASMDAPATWAVAAFGVWVLVWFGAARHRAAPWSGPPAGRAAVAGWSLGCVAVPAALFLLAWGLAGEGSGGAAGGPGGSTSLPPLPARELTPLGLLSALAVNLSFGGSLGEEPGWRGAWLPRLLRRHSAFEATAIVSFWWALWHSPIDLAQGFGLPGVGGLVMRQFWTFPVTVLFTWVTLRGGGSLLPALALHTTVNSFSDFVVAQPARHEQAMGLFLAFCLVAAVVCLAADHRVWTAGQCRSQEGQPETDGGAGAADEGHPRPGPADRRPAPPRATRAG